MSKVRGDFFFTVRHDGRSRAMYNWREIQGRWGRLFLSGRVSIATRNRDRRATEKRISSKRNQSERSWTQHLLPKDFHDNFKHSGAICRVHTLPWTLPSASTTSQTRGERRKDRTGRHPEQIPWEQLEVSLLSRCARPWLRNLGRQSPPPRVPCTSAVRVHVG
jgi:hypothetical protein